MRIIEYINFNEFIADIALYITVNNGNVILLEDPKNLMTGFLTDNDNDKIWYKIRIANIRASCSKREELKKIIGNLLLTKEGRTSLIKFIKIMSKNNLFMNKYINKTDSNKDWQKIYMMRRACE